MSLRKTTQSIISRVESISDCPVHVTQDLQLKTLAAVRMARGSQRVHSITYNPLASQEPDYLICFQCGFILRLYSLPPAERFDFTGSEKGRMEAMQLLDGSGVSAQKLGLSDDVLKGLCDQFFNGLMTQLRSIPIGLRVDAWLMIGGR